MKYILSLFLILAALRSESQVIVNDVNINDLQDVEYIEMVAISKMFSVSKVTVTIDYGQPFKFGDDQRIAGPNGKPIVFDSYMAAMNFLAKNGWEYHDAFTITHSSANVYHFIFRKQDDVKDDVRD